MARLTDRQLRQFRWNFDVSGNLIVTPRDRKKYGEYIHLPDDAAVIELARRAGYDGDDPIQWIRDNQRQWKDPAR